jgi:chromosome segregation ATPase
MGKLKDLLFYNDNQEGPAPAAPQRAPSQANCACDEMATAIKKATLARKTPFTALLEASDKLAGVIADASTRLKAAYATIGNEFRSIDQISKSIDLHISDVDGEKMRFLQATQNKRALEVNGLKSKISGLEKENRDLQKEYDELQKRSSELVTSIGNNRVQIESANQEATKKEAEIAGVEQQFETAARQVKDEFDQQKKIILSTLK